MIPTLIGVADGHLHRHPVRAGRPGRAARGRDARASQSGEGGALHGAKPRHRRQADRGAEEALRLRQAAARALRRDARQLRAFDLGRSFLHNKDVWALIKEKLPVSISLGAVDLPARRTSSRFRSASRRRCARARASTRSTTLLVLIGYRDSRLRARRPADRAVRRRHASSTGSRCAASRRTTGRAVVAGAHRRLLLAPDAAAASACVDRQLRGRRRC